MIELAQASITIMVPIDSVFKYVSNMENYIDWFPGVVGIRSENSLAHGEVGKQYSEILSLPSGNTELEIEVFQCELNELFLTKGNLPGVLPQMTIAFNSIVDSGCEINLQYHSRNPELTPTSDIVLTLREDLHDRAHRGLIQLKGIMELGR